MYPKGGGLIKVFGNYFGYEVMLSSSPGLASILVFRKYCHFALENADVGDDKNLSNSCSINPSRDMNQYKGQFDTDTVNEGFSSTLTDLLGEINIRKLTSILVGMICFLFYLLIFHL